MRIEEVNHLKELLNATIIVMQHLVDFGGKDICCELDENGYGNPFVDIWDNQFNNGKSIAYIGIDGGKIVITNNLTNQFVTDINSFKDIFKNNTALLS